MNFDQKNHQENIIKWIKDIAFDKSLSLLFVERLENGNLEEIALNKLP